MLQWYSFSVFLPFASKMFIPFIKWHFLDDLGEVLWFDCMLRWLLCIFWKPFLSFFVFSLEGSYFFSIFFVLRAFNFFYWGFQFVSPILRYFGRKNSGSYSILMPSTVTRSKCPTPPGWIEIWPRWRRNVKIELFIFFFFKLFHKGIFWAIKKCTCGKYLSPLLCAGWIYTYWRKKGRQRISQSAVPSSLLFLPFSSQWRHYWPLVHFPSASVFSYFQVFWCQLVVDLLLNRTCTDWWRRKRRRKKAKVTPLLYLYYSMVFWLDWLLINRKRIFHLEKLH